MFVPYTHKMYIHKIALPFLILFIVIKVSGDGFIFLFLISRTLPFLRVSGSLKDSSHLPSFRPEKLSSEPTIQYLKPQRSKSNGIGGFKRESGPRDERTCSMSSAIRSSRTCEIKDFW